MRDLNDFAYFEAVVRHRGFGAASRATGVPKSRLSRRLRDLEDRLGARLIERSTHKFEVTRLGEDFYAHCRAALAEMDKAEEATQFFTGEPRGLLRVSTPPGVCANAIAAMLPDFLGDYPGARVQLIVGIRRVDIIEEQVDVAVRVRSRLDTDADLVVKQLGTLQSVLVASPELVGRMGMPARLSDLAAWPTIANQNNGPEVEWTLMDEAGATCVLRHRPVAASDDMDTNMRLVLAGVGAALMPEEIVRGELDSGRLLRILPGCTTDKSILHLAFASRRGMLPIVRLFIDRVSVVLARSFRL